MRGVNIHADFVMIQCAKNKNLTPLSHPLCHPAIRRGSKIPLAYGSRLRRGKRHLPDKLEFIGVLYAPASAKRQ